MSTGGETQNQADGFEMVREAMVERLRTHYRISDERVLSVMQRLPRHQFLPAALAAQAYKDNAVPIGGGQTISQPFIVARMTELLALKGDEKVLEIGAGSGYQSAILASLARKVFAIERLPQLAAEAEQRLRALGLRNITVKTADGTEGWDTYRPFDAILVAAGGPVIPEPLIAQLKTGGKLVIPVGNEERSQRLVLVTKTALSYTTEDHGPVSFVPLIGSFGWKESKM
jgi:protein-L-isoaspartate(D-aspartate) O-methyltransferase